MTVPQRNDRTLELLAIADRIENIEWPDEEPTIPNLTVNLNIPSTGMTTAAPEKVSESKPPSSAKLVPTFTKSLVSVLTLLPPWGRVLVLVVLIVAAGVGKYFGWW